MALGFDPMDVCHKCLSAKVDSTMTFLIQLNSFTNPFRDDRIQKGGIRPDSGSKLLNRLTKNDDIRVVQIMGTV